jgi:hypothetical protein
MESINDGDVVIVDHDLENYWYAMKNQQEKPEDYLVWKVHQFSRALFESPGTSTKVFIIKTIMVDEIVRT